MSQKEVIAKAPVSRVRRSTLGRKQILKANGKDPDFEYRFVNDEGDRIQQFLDAGWVHEDDVKVGDKRVESASSEGKHVQVSVGQGRKAFLMKIPKDFFEEDQRAKQAHLDETEAAMKNNALDGNYGKLEITRR